MISHPTSSESSSASEILCSNLAQGIHAAAQPLAVLLASLSNDYTDQMNSDELRELTASSAAEVRRVCTLFSSLQQLVMAESIKPQLSLTPLLPLLAHAADGVSHLFQRDGISLRSVLPDACPPVHIHRARTLQALSRVLLIVHGLSRAQDTVELIASASANEVQIVIQNQSLSVATINPEAKLSMAVAEANMRSQQAGLWLSLQPFTVRIELPRAPFA
jgi:signal transduction histidine kinase